MYFFGFGVPRDKKEAMKWYRKAAEQGYADAQFNISKMYYKGDGVSQDYAEAAKWYRKAAEQGHDWAQYNLGWMYFCGEGVPKDYAALLLCSHYGEALNPGWNGTEWNGIGSNCCTIRTWTANTLWKIGVNMPGSSRCTES